MTPAPRPVRKGPRRRFATSKRNIFSASPPAPTSARRGEKEVEVTTDANFRKRAGRFSTLSTKVELGICADAIPATRARRARDGPRHPQCPRRRRRQPDAIRRPVGPRPNICWSSGRPISLSPCPLIVEPAWSRVGGEGGRERAFEIESKLAGDVMLIPNRLYAAVNLIWEPEAVKDRGARAYARESTLGLTGALTWRATPRSLWGGELGYFRAYDSYLLSKYVG
jgi:hypothetical protein